MQGKGMQSPVMVASQEGIASAAVNIEARAARDDQPVLIVVFIVNSFYPLFPLRALMELVECQIGIGLGPGLLENHPAIVLVVPVE